MITVRRLHWLSITQLGFDPKVTFRSLKALPRYVKGYWTLRGKYEGPVEFTPCLQDWFKQAGETESDYFWQDLIVARMIFDAKPKKHVDVGSRIDGFIAHLAAFREVEVFDIRPLAVPIPGVTFRQVDLMAPGADFSGLEGYCDSLSCLHALEHFGLGRYGDEIDPDGFERGFANMARMLSDGGTFYLSVPIGINRIEFNAHRVSDPRMIVDMAERNGLLLSSLTTVKDGREVKRATREDLADLARARYVLGVFVLVKKQS